VRAVDLPDNWQQEFLRIAQEMHDEKYGKAVIPELTNKTYDALNGGHLSGRNIKFGDEAGADPAVLNMQRNLFRFSGAKSFAIREELNHLLHKDGKKRPWEDFKTEALKINEKYNVNHLQAEYQTAHAAGQHARNWEKYQSQKKLFPNLKYRTVGDARVRDEHAKLEGIIAPIDSDFWKKYYPPNGWRCFPPETLILTEKGWKQIKNIKQRDWLPGGSGEMKFVEAVHVNPFRGNLITINDAVSCTPNHRFLTAKGWIEAEQIEAGDIIIQVGKVGFFYKVLHAVHNTVALVQYVLMAVKRRFSPAALQVND